MKLNWKEDVLGAVWKELERETGGGYDISLHNFEILKKKFSARPGAHPFNPNSQEAEASGL